MASEGSEKSACAKRTLFCFLFWGLPLSLEVGLSFKRRATLTRYKANDPTTWTGAILTHPRSLAAASPRRLRRAR